MFGLGWFFSFGPGDLSTEAYIGMYSWQQEQMRNDWANMQVSAQMSLDEVLLDYMNAQANALPEANPKWESISN
jgi:hypothetical protein